jgi:hydroxymethylbilane synthase
MQLLPTDVVLPAPGQGALALQCRSNDKSTRQVLGLLNDPSTAVCVASERRLVELLHGDCHSPIAAWARIDDDLLTFEAAVGKRDGSPPVLRTSATGISNSASDVVDTAFTALKAHGVTNLLNGE